MTRKNTNFLIDKTFQQGSVLCKIWATKEGELTEGALCVTSVNLSYIKSGFGGERVIHYPRLSSIITIEHGVFLSSVIIDSSGTKSKFQCDKHEIHKLFHSLQSPTIP